MLAQFHLPAVPEPPVSEVRSGAARHIPRRRLLALGLGLAGVFLVGCDAEIPLPSYSVRMADEAAERPEEPEAGAQPAPEGADAEPPPRQPVVQTFGERLHSFWRRLTRVP